MGRAGHRRWPRQGARGWGSVPGLLVLAVSGCGLPAGEGAAPADPCRIGRGAGEAGLLPVIGVVDPVDGALAPLARSDGEGLLFATLHPPLVQLDCEGRLRPAVAAAWEVESARDGEVVWHLAIPGARERGDLVARSLARDAPSEGGVRPIGVERTPSGVRVRLRGRGVQSDGPRVLAEPGLVPVAATGDGWGSDLSGLRLVPVAAPGPGRTLELVREDGDRAVALAAIRVVPGGDPRDLVDQGADLVLTRDPLAVAWAAARDGVRVLPLPADRVYRMALPGAGLRELPEGLPAGLVRDVVPLGGIPGSELEAEGGAGGCPPLPSSPRPPRRPPDLQPRVVHPLGDAVARALAERVAALAAPGGDAPLAGLLRGVSESVPLLEVVGLDPAGFARALREGRDVAYVFHEPLHPAALCSAGATRARRIPWLESGSVLALVESGPRALVRPGAPVLEVDGTGAVRMLFPPGDR